MSEITNKLATQRLILFEKLIFNCFLNNFPTMYGAQISLLCSEELDTGSYPETIESRAHPHILVHFIIIFL
jgi:hypothetical protein